MNFPKIYDCSIKLLVDVITLSFMQTLIQFSIYIQITLLNDLKLENSMNKEQIYFVIKLIATFPKQQMMCKWQTLWIFCEMKRAEWEKLRIYLLWIIRFKCYDVYIRCWCTVPSKKEREREREIYGYATCWIQPCVTVW